MKFLKNKKVTISMLITFVTILVIVLFTYNEKKPVFLSQIFPTSKIQNTKDTSHYFVDSKEYYAREIVIGDITLNLVVENYQNEGSIYRFYSFGLNPKLLKEVESFIPPENSEQVLTKNLFTKEITGDTIPELFIKLESSANNVTSYEILRLENNSLINIKLSMEKNNWVSFDEIEYRNGYVAMTWHASDATGEVRYELKDNVLVPIRNIGFFLIQGTEDNCEIRENKVYDDFVVIGKEKCSVLGTNFDPYFN
jgi:hypothetical protein